MQVYKVVERLDDGTLVSVVAYGRARVVYTPNEWTAAPDWLRRHGYHLTAFSNYDDAYFFAKAITAFRPREIWLAEAKGVIEKLPPPRFLIHISEGKFTDLEYGVWPNGTVMCKALKLVRKLKEIKPKT